MTAGDELHGHVDYAGNHLHDALKNWDAGSLPHCEECCQLLRRAISELECAWRGAENGAAASTATRTRLYHLRADVNLMIRLVDASTSFCRGMAFRIGAGGTETSPEPHAAPSFWAPREA